MVRNASDVWVNQSRQWDLVGSPLRPGPEDQTARKILMDRWSGPGEPDLAVILGVTPEITRMPWPVQTRVLAIDISPNMIGRVWSSDRTGPDRAICADWLQLPLAPDSVDFVASDGCFGVLRYPDQHVALLRSLRRTLREDGLFVFRIFVQPESSETRESIYGDVMEEATGSFHAFKLRLLMAAQQNSATGVCTGDVWNSWTSDGPGAESLASRRHWPMAQISTIEAYRNQTSTYFFPTADEIRNLLAEEGFIELQCLTPSYKLGDRCPTFACRPAPR